MSDSDNGQAGTAVVDDTRQEEEESNAQDGKMEANINNSNSNKEDGEGETHGDKQTITTTSYSTTSSSASSSSVPFSSSEMPVLKYARLMGSLPRITADPEGSKPKILSVPCVCTAMARIAGTAHQPSTYNVMAMGMKDGTIHLIDARTGDAICPSALLSILPPKRRSVMGGVAGTVGGGGGAEIVDLCFDASGSYLAAITKSGHAAIFEFRYGVVTVLDKEMESNNNHSSETVSPTKKNAQPQQSVFNTFLSKLAGDDETPAPSPPPPPAPSPKESSRENSNSTASPTRKKLALTHAVVTARITYEINAKSNHHNENTTTNSDSDTAKAAATSSSSPTSSKTNHAPTCLALDPSYKRQRQKLLIVGFGNGRVVLTKRSGHGGDPTTSSVAAAFDGADLGGGAGVGGLGGAMGLFLQPRRNDLDLYQGSGSGKSEEYLGIEALAWRGSLLCWADASGVMLFDMAKMARISRVHRPSGARASLYPTISTLRPHLLFETSNSLLIAWGDCLMSMSIREDVVKTIKPPSGHDGTSTSTQPTIVRKTILETSMAWQLDCIACGVVPIDKEHVAVLGLVPVPSAADGEEEEQDAAVGGMGLDGVEGGEGEVELEAGEFAGMSPSGRNLVDLQIVSRSNGTLTSSDALPLLFSPVSSGGNGVVKADAATGYSFVSSFGTPRVDDATELENEMLARNDDEDVGFDMQASIFDAVANSLNETNTSTKERVFQDMHLKWHVDCIARDDQEDQIEKKSDAVEPKEAGENDHTNDENEPLDSSKLQDDLSIESSNSDDTDDYTFLFKPKKTTRQRSTPSLQHLEPPIMVITSPHDAVLVQARDVDDAISHARAGGYHGLALRRALRNRQIIRRHSLKRLVNEYLTAVLFPSVDDGINGERSSSALTVRRLRLAARATPILFGGDIDLWEKWVHEFAKIPGGLFVLRPFLPVRDPKLPSYLYEFVLETMFIEMELMLNKPDDDENLDRIGSAKKMLVHENTIELYLNALRAWGPISSLKEKIKLHKFFNKHDEWRSRENINSTALQQVETDFSFRMTQSAANYLQSPPAQHSSRMSVHAVNQPAGITFDALFNISNVATYLLPKTEKGQIEKQLKTCAVALEAIAELCLMKGDYVEALKFYLGMGALFPSVPISVLEDAGINWITDSEKQNSTVLLDKTAQFEKYQHVIAMVESHQMHSLLLKQDFLASFYEDKNGLTASTPITALICLVGLEISSHFFLEHCILPRSSLSSSGPESYDAHSTSLPLHLVANQLKANPKLMHWCLHKIFCEKPEVYVKFPNTAVPPRSVTDLHRAHLELHIEFADRSEDKGRNLSDVPSYEELSKESPLMIFLKAALPHGGIRSDDVRRMLEGCRRGQKGSSLLKENSKSNGGEGQVKFPHLFASELAFVIERSGSGTVDDAKTVLTLYLEGAKLLPLAVSYTERNTPHSAMLWDLLVSYCLENKPDGTPNIDREGGPDGVLFGSLLEVAAQSGADLAHLVSKIPKGMCIKGIKAKLVSAISDYRLKVKIHESVSLVLETDKVSLLRELTHRSRRGMRVDMPVGLGQRMLEEKRKRESRNASLAGSVESDSVPAFILDKDQTVYQRPRRPSDRPKKRLALPIR